ncbi:hypothetical protein N9W57_06465 [Pseudomonadales bacterium]|nr:hypothetical protein [Pseudomonadales bacterium]
MSSYAVKIAEGEGNSMETFNAILIAFGGNAMLLAVLAWLARSIFSEFFKRRLIDRKIIFTKLQEERVEAVKEVYIGLTEYLSLCQEFIFSAPHVDENKRVNLLATLGRANIDFKKTLQRNKLYLTNNLCDQIQQVFKETATLSNSYIFVLGAYKSDHVSEDQHKEKWVNSYQSLMHEIPSLLKAVEEEFKILLGSEEYNL